MVQLTRRREDIIEKYKHGVVMNVGVDLETREERKLYFKKESGTNMYLENKLYES